MSQPLPATMRAVRAYGPRDYRIETIQTPRAGSGEIVIRVDASGICGSDGKCYNGGAMFWGTDTQASWVKAPVTPGHEFVGTVTELGEGAATRHGVALGDRVIAEQIYPCDRCRYCQRGQYWMCQVHDIYGFQGGIADGAWAQYMRFGERSRVHRVPSDLPLEAGVLIEPLACAIHAVERANIQLGDTVILAGAGTLGLLMLQVIRLKHPACLIVHDTKDERLALARLLGADQTVNIKRDDPVEHGLSFTDGYGADVFIEASGSPQAVTVGIQSLRKLGTFVAFGVFREETSLDWSIIGDRKELTIHGSHLGPDRYPLAIHYLHSGIVQYAPIVTHRFALEDFQAGLDTLLSGNGIKVVLHPEIRGSA